MRIDAHQHFWHPARGDYGWMPADDPVLSRPYGPKDLEQQLEAAGVGATVLVQAAPSLCETEYMLGLADATPQVAAVVGWIDFERSASAADMRRIARHPKLRGLRPMLQDLPDDRWLLRDDVQWAFPAMADLGLALDVLGFPRHLRPVLATLGRHPELRAVIDHCLKPRIGDPDTFLAWAEGMSALARETGAFCKLSGLVTEAAADWTVEDLRPYVEHVLEVFGPERVMWGSDWPVLRLRCEYAAWVEATRRLLDELTETERARVLGGTAAAFYRIAP